MKDIVRSESTQECRWYLKILKFDKNYGSGEDKQTLVRTAAMKTLLFQNCVYHSL